MLLATGVMLLQLSAVMSAKPVVGVKPAPAVTTANVPAAISSESSHSTAPALSNLRLTALNFADTSDTSATPVLPKSMEAATTPDAASITPIHVPDPVHVPKMKAQKHAGVESVEQYPRRTWFILMVADHGASAFDAYSTRYAVGHGAVEENPLMRPFVHSDSIYAVSQITPAVMDLVARRMMRSQNGFIRHMWFVPQTLSFGTYVFAGAHNMQVASRQP
ncbi:MAG TPA: hypothetical protein VMF66_16775 [Candidatus Acidoferrum sp.]|nr:hypothetical protein [Candidatus Acidoferrum sp.]